MSNHNGDYRAITAVRISCIFAIILNTIGLGILFNTNFSFLVALALSMTTFGAIYVAMGCARVFLKNQAIWLQTIQVAKPHQATAKATPSLTPRQPGLGEPDLDAMDQAELARFRAGRP